ncbi:hypothetical protein PIB30_083314 [Stylosanthes scabra]|uniref:Uncharacterized protein n=1 Tax=Stylosanthes scabra TaxID=79078 RepID=A0ABU6TRQ3_9FABA|nr:hypothetical protein [Stylosanthes scabra]
MRNILVLDMEDSQAYIKHGFILTLLLRFLKMVRKWVTTYAIIAMLFFGVFIHSSIPKFHDTIPEEPLNPSNYVESDQKMCIKKCKRLYLNKPEVLRVCIWKCDGLLGLEYK